MTHGNLVKPDVLFQHNRLGANYGRARSGLPLRHEGADIVVPATGNAQASDGEALRRLALSGLGLFGWPLSRCVRPLPQACCCRYSKPATRAT